MIVLDSEFKVEIDNQNFTLIRTTEKEGKDKKTGEDKIIVSTEQYFYPDLGGCLRTYLRESLRPAESVEEVILKIEEVHKTIKSLKNVPV